MGHRYMNLDYGKKMVEKILLSAVASERITCLVDSEANNNESYSEELQEEKALV